MDSSYRDPHLITWTHMSHWVSLQMASRSVHPFYTAHSRDSQCFSVGRTTPKIAPCIRWGSRPSKGKVQCNAWFLGCTRVTHKNGISIGSIVFVGSPTWLTDRHTDRQTDHATPSVARLHLVVLRCGLIIHFHREGIEHEGRKPQSSVAFAQACENCILVTILQHYQTFREIRRIARTT